VRDAPATVNSDIPPELRLKPPRKENPIKTIAFVALVALLVGFGTMYFIGQRHQPAGQAKCSGQCILLRANGADPSALSVITGSFVSFASADGQHHNLSLDDHAAQDYSAYQSGDFKADESWKVQFKQDGAYSFTDKDNAKIHIDIVVYTPDKNYKIQ
jgi:plastocyanin